MDVYQFDEQLSFEMLRPVSMDVKTQEFKASTTLVLQKMRVRVEIVGNFAKTSTLMTFYNSADHTLAGELVFPLPKGVNIHGEFFFFFGNTVVMKNISSKTA